MDHEVTAEDLHEIMREALPAGSPQCELVFVGAMERDDNLIAVLQLFIYDVDEATGERRIRDIKEQEVYFVPESCRDSRARVAAYVRAWAAVLEEVLTPLGDAEVLSWSMPHELVHPSALKLARAETEEDFKKALRAKTRLGGLLARASQNNPAGG